MGIAKLAELLKEEAPEAVRTVSLERFRGQVVALDASVAIYQFRTAMPKIVNRHGQNISPLQGLFYRTLYLLENGIKPVFVFDGKPPDLKQTVLAKRAAVTGITKEAEDSTSDLPERLRKQDSETLLSCLGVPYVQFVDLCILLGCDYCEKIRGFGPKKALKLLQQHGSIEQVVQHTCRQKHPLPDNWPLEETRRLFLQPEVAQMSQVALEWREPDEKKLVQFLAREKHMNESRVCRRMEKWRESRLKQIQPQLMGSLTEGSPRQQKIGEFFRIKKHQSEGLSSQPCRKKQRPKDQPETATGT